MDSNDNDYGNEDNYDGNEPADEGGNEPADGEVDQYFDDAGDIGYLPADHVTNNPLNHRVAPDATAAERVDEAADGRARAHRPEAA